MRIPTTMLTAAALLAPTLLVFSQTKNPVVETSSASTSTTLTAKELDQLPLHNPFAKGNYQFEFKKNIEANYLNNFENSQSTGHQDHLKFDLGADLFVAKGFAVGLEGNFDFKGVHTPSSDNTTSKWMAYANLEYGFPITKNFDLYGRASFGLGSSTATFKSSGTDTGSSNSSTTKDKLFGYKFAVAAPLRIFENGPIYVSPQVSWDYRSTSFTGGKEIYSGLSVCLGIEAFFGCHDYECDSHHNFENSSDIYQPRTSFIEYSTRGQFEIGSNKTSYSGYGSTSPGVKYNKYDLNFSYGYYFLNNIAIGAGIQLGGSTQNDQNNDNKMTTGRWEISPMLIFNLPVDNGWNNTFLRIEAGFGSEKNTLNSGSYSTSMKTNIFGYSGMVGYHDFIGKRAAFTTEFGYGCNFYKDPNTNIKQKSDGFEVQFGVTLFGGPKWIY